MSIRRLCLAVLLVAVACEDSPTEGDRLEVEAEVLRAWTTEVALVTSVRAQNQQLLSAVTVQQRDAAWSAGTATTLEQSVLTGACANRLRALAATSDHYVEVLLMDNQGALVCASRRTTDYWQGDEDKWQRAWANGSGATFISSAALDASTGERLVHISLPVREGATLIGALSVGIAIERF